jgi:hypothetical protein
METQTNVKLLITAQLSESNKTTARGHRESMVVGFTTTYIQSGPITTNFSSLNPTQAIQHYEFSELKVKPC